MALPAYSRARTQWPPRWVPACGRTRPFLMARAGDLPGTHESFASNLSMRNRQVQQGRGRPPPPPPPRQLNAPSCPQAPRCAWDVALLLAHQRSLSWPRSTMSPSRPRAGWTMPRTRWPSWAIPLGWDRSARVLRALVTSLRCQRLPRPPRPRCRRRCTSAAPSYQRLEREHLRDVVL